MSATGYRPVAGYAVHRLDTGEAEPAFLVESADGRRWRASEGTVQLLDALAAHPTLEGAAAEVAARWARPVEPGALAGYLDRVLVPQGMVEAPDGPPGRSEREAGGRLAALSFRATILPARWLRPVSGALRFAFHPALFWPVFAAATAAMVVLILPAAGRVSIATLVTPGVVLLMLLSTFVHELGHAAACRRFGCRHGPLGFGLYLVFPVLFMDVDETWRLPRGQRAIVDAGGLYLQVIFGLGLMACAQVWPAFREAALGTLVLIGLAFVFNLNPLFRFDGYWLLSDVLGIPNLRRRSMQALRTAFRALRGGEARPDPMPLSPRTTRLLALFGVLSVGFWIVYFGRLLLRLPAFATREYPSLAGAALDRAGDALTAGDPVRAVAAVLTLVPPTALLAGLVVLVAVQLRGLIRSVARARPSAPPPLPREARP